MISLSLTPMHSATSLFSSDIGGSIVKLAISSNFNQINFTWVGPWTIDWVLWHQPQSRPNPITSWQFSADLNCSELECEWVDCCNLCASDRVDDVVNTSGSLASPITVVCAFVSWNTNISWSQEVFWVCVSCECWSQVEISSGDVRVETVINVPLELPVSTTGQGVFVSPNWLIKSIEVIFENQLTSANLSWCSCSTDGGDRWVTLTVGKTNGSANSCYNNKTLHCEFLRNTANYW